MKKVKPYIPLIILIFLRYFLQSFHLYFKDITVVYNVHQLYLSAYPIIVLVVMWFGSKRITEIRKNVSISFLYIVFLFDITYSFIERIFKLFNIESNLFKQGFDFSYYIFFALLIFSWVFTIINKNKFEISSLKSDKFDSDRIYLYARIPKTFIEKIWALINVRAVGSFGFIYKGIQVSYRRNTSFIGFRKFSMNRYYILREISPEDNHEFFDRIGKYDKKFNIINNNCLKFCADFGYNVRNIFKK